MPKGTPNETCGDHGGTNRRDEPCGRAAGWGTDFDSGKCRRHRGTSPDGESHEGNQNAVSHSVYAEHSNFYQNKMTDAERELCDDILDGYLELWEQRHGTEPVAGFEHRLFEIAVNHIKSFYVDDWMAARPEESLESGNPLVDRETHYSDEGDEYHQYTEAVVIGAQQKLRREDRQWLSKFDLLPGDGGQSEAIGTLASAIKRVANA